MEIERKTKSVAIADDWYVLLEEEFDKPYFQKLVNFVRQEYSTQQIFPHGKEIFRAFDLCPIEQLKVVIIGQDPYHGIGQANGLSFSVAPNMPFPPSLKNIFTEVTNCGYTQQPKNGDLERWAKQGVLLLNSVLTVRAHIAASHAGQGWEQFTDAVIREVNRKKQNIVYMLWGAYAQKKAQLVDAKHNLVLGSVHPSPLSAYRGFFGSGHFANSNSYFREYGIEEINW